ncbi:Noc2-domain-containing protein [Dentipellis sp. KUC8613]|nr:Noc2-domain-containing protein [Dentipellis sp. KUC8613]
MAKKGAKATRKFAASGQLKKTIQARHKHQQIQKKIHKKQAAKKGKPARGKEREDEGAEEDDDEVEEKGSKSNFGRFKGMSVDDFLGGGFMDEDDEEASDEEDEEDEEEFDDNESFASVDDLDDHDEGAAHLQELSKLAEKDPEFYKYLQENDRELLDFDPTAAVEDSDEEGEDEDVEMDEGKTPVLTKQILQKWQKALLDKRSLRALRKLLIAFRSAAHMNEEGEVVAWTIDNSSVYHKLVTTALRYTPIVLEHHCPYKTLPNGKFKAPTQTHKLKTLQKLILSYFHNVIHLIPQLTDTETSKLAVSESAKLVPYIVSSRRSVKAYLKLCLNVWSTAEDDVRLTAFLALRKLASASDESIMDMVLKGTYMTLVRSTKSTTPHNLPSILLMKNSASEIFCLDHALAYQHAFSFIRQLAIHLRTSMKMKTKESFKQVYNWQYVHSVDFWSLVLARACDKKATAERGGKESELQPLIYPLVQVATGAMKLVSTARTHPLHLHLLRSLIHLSRHTHTYIPLAPHLLPILTTALSTLKPKSSTLKPLDLDTTIRAPQQYLGTRIYTEGLADEAAFLLAEWLAAPAVHGSIAFPELVVPLTVVLRKAAKGSTSGGSGSAKAAGAVKALVERVEESARWVAARRERVPFAPARVDAVRAWEDALGEEAEEGPLGKYVRVQRKVREKRRRMVEKAREGGHEVLEE